MTYNAKQQAFIDHPGERIILHACAGAGKTHALIGRIVADQKRGIDPKGQVVITYTVAAAENLLDRITGTKPGFVGTIHAFCLKLCRERFKELGYFKPPAVFDEDESKKLLKEIADSIGCKGNAEEYRGQELTRTAEQLAARQHLRVLRQRGLADFVTMQYDSLRLLVGKGGRMPFSALYCDEYQDVTQTERGIFEELEADIKVYAGDEDQYIYSWREGRYETACMLGLVNDTHLDLDINHRSDYRIVGAANNIIGHFKHTRPMARLNIANEATAKDGAIGSHIRPDETERNKLCLNIAENDLRDGKSVAILCRYNATVAALKASCSLSMAMLLPDQTQADLRSPDHRAAKRVLEFLAGGEDCEITAGHERFLTWEPASAIRYFNLTARQIRICEYAICKANGEKRDALNAYLALGQTQEDTGKFHVGTIHGAKGKEWDSVIVCGCEDSTWEGKQNADDNELRRLFYVASTRPRHRLTYASAGQMFNQSTGRLATTKQSKFLLEAIGE